MGFLKAGPSRCQGKRARIRPFARQQSPLCDARIMRLDLSDQSLVGPDCGGERFGLTLAACGQMPTRKNAAGFPTARAAGRSRRSRPELEISGRTSRVEGHPEMSVSAELRYDYSWNNPGHHYLDIYHHIRHK